MNVQIIPTKLPPVKITINHSRTCKCVNDWTIAAGDVFNNIIRVCYNGKKASITVKELRFSRIAHFSLRWRHLFPPNATKRPLGIVVDRKVGMLRLNCFPFCRTTNMSDWLTKAFLLASQSNSRRLFCYQGTIKCPTQIVIVLFWQRTLKDLTVGGPDFFLYLVEIIPSEFNMVSAKWLYVSVF